MGYAYTRTRIVKILGEMSHPSCIKMPHAKECSVVPIADNRDRVCNRRDLTLMADEIFGVNKWSHSITNQTIDFTKFKEGKYFVGCSAIIRVQLADGTHHEDMGYSNSNASDEGLAIFTARTGSITDALKNTLLCFGGGIAAKIDDFMKAKTERINNEGLTISAIGEPKKIVMLPKTRMMTPNAQSTPEKSSIVAPINIAVENNNKEAPMADKHERKIVLPKYQDPAKSDGNKINKLDAQSVNPNERMLRSPKCSKQVENGAKVNKPVLSTDEEKRLERKRRQAQLQEEFKRLHKDGEYVEKQNARF